MSKFNAEELNKMNFNDPFELKDLDADSYEEPDCCIICGNIISDLKIGFNEKEQLLRFECANCNSVYVTTPENNRSDRIMIKGEPLNWPEYLMEKLKFPFDVTIIEESDKAFFLDDYDGPRVGDDARVLEVFYSFKYGVEALVRIGRKTYQHLLAWVAVEDCDNEELRNDEIVENYKRWRERYWGSDFITVIRAYT